MQPTNDQEAPNKTVALLRRLATEKREIQRQMRQAFTEDSEVQRIVNELDNLNAQRKHQSV